MKKHVLDSLQDNRVKGYQPTFSVIIALYNAEEYFESTIKALSAQTIAQEELEFIVVNDGSTDSSLALAHQWADRDHRVVVASKPNRGIGNTRNVGLALARGKWITAVDPDDLVNKHYFEEIYRLMQNDVEDQVALYSTRIYPTNGANGWFRDNHPLGQKFKGGNRFISMVEDPNTFQMGATCVFRKSLVDQYGLTYDELLKPTFEDGHLIARYLCHFEDPVVGIVSTAHYYYRRRVDGSSAVQSGWSKVEKFTVQPQRGYISVLEYAQKTLGHTPDWLAAMVLYDLVWYFKINNQMDSPVNWLDSEVSNAFMQACQKIFSYISLEQIILLKPNAPIFALRESFVIGFGVDGISTRFYIWGETPDGLLDMKLFTRGGVENLQTKINGEPVDIKIDGTKIYEFYDNQVMLEVSFRVPKEGFQIFIDGKAVRNTYVRVKPKQLPVSTLAAKLNKNIVLRGKVYSKAEKIQERLFVESLIREEAQALVLAKKVPSAFKRARRKLTAKAESVAATKFATLHKPLPGLSRRSESRSSQVVPQPAVNKYQDCWLLLDHPDRADDNAEHLYRYLKQNRPDINAYFVLAPASKDYQRLHTEGFDLIPYGSDEMYRAADSALVVASSDAVRECMYLKRKGPVTYKFIFLQHGVLFNDLSTWLNPKQIDLVISTTQREYDQFVWDRSRYKYTTQNVALTGLARYDGLMAQVEKAGNKPQEQRLLVMPTWRRDLKTQMAAARSLAQKLEIFRTSDFYSQWKGCLDRLEATGQFAGISILLHPNMADHIDVYRRAFGIEVLDGSQISFQSTIVQYSSFLTDYSSLMFDCLYAGLSVAYYQPEALSVSSGSHTWKSGFVNYESLDLGPVLKSEDELERWAISLSVTKADKRLEIFRYVDSMNSQRICAAIESVVAGDFGKNSTLDATLSEAVTNRLQQWYREISGGPASTIPQRSGRLRRFLGGLSAQ